MSIPSVRLKRKEEKRILAGHLWVFSNEIEKIEGTPETGDVVEVRSGKNEPLGFGFFNPKTLIAVRLFSKEFVEPDKQFFIDRLRSALELRGRLFDVPFYRLAYGESDFLPGLIIDRFDSIFSVQVFSAAMEKRRDMIYESIKELFSPDAVYEKNESSTRILEGLAQSKSVIYGEERSVDYEEDGVVFRINPFRGQKTGFYLDQRANRIFSRRFGGDAHVLDLFSNEGGFGLNLARAGAIMVQCVDSSEQSVDSLRVNSEINGFKNVEGIVLDVDSFLRKAVSSGEKYDVVVCDPPSFTKNKRSVTPAKAGYRHLHENIFAVLKPGGILLTASCSHHIFRQTFEDVVALAARKTGRTLQLLHRAGAAPDHPVLPAMPETEYLKFNAYRVF